MIYVCALFIYVLAMAVMCWVGFSQGSWLAVSGPYVLNFRKPVFCRVGTGMLAVLFLTGAAFFLWDEYTTGVSYMFLSIICLVMACFFAYVAGPQDVTVDIESGVCHETFGWMVHPRKRSLALTEASCLATVCSGGTSYVFLMIGGGSKRYFMIAATSSMSDAYSIASPISQKLHLSIKETNIQGLRQLF